MAAQPWFVVGADGEEEGPLAPSELKRRVASGDVTEATLVRRADQDRAVEAGRIRGLFPAEARLEEESTAADHEGEADPNRSPRTSRVERRPRAPRVAYAPLGARALIASCALGL